MLSKDHYNKISRGKRFEFDTLHQKKFNFSIIPLKSPGDYKVFANDPLELFTRTGLRVSVNFRYHTQPWRKAEYENEHLISVNYGLLRKTLNIGYVGRLRQIAGKWDALFRARVDIPAVENFYGTGNNTVSTGTTPTYYTTTSDRIFAGGGLTRDFGKFHHVEFGALYQLIKVDRNNIHLFDEIQMDQSVFAAKQFSGVEAGYRFNKTNNDIYPTKGFRFVLGGGYVQNINDKSRKFFKANSSFAFYVPLGNSFSIAVRAGGATLTGEADYYHLNTLGGNENLRGYPRERFFGKNTFYNNNELRWVINTNNYLFAGKIGLLAFYDHGRVWQPGESSNLWHSGYGGGLIVIPFNKVALTGTYGISKESTQIALQAQIFF